MLRLKIDSISDLYTEIRHTMSNHQNIVRFFSTQRLKFYLSRPYLFLTFPLAVFHLRHHIVITYIRERLLIARRGKRFIPRSGCNNMCVLDFLVQLLRMCRLHKCIYNGDITTPLLIYIPEKRFCPLKWDMSLAGIPGKKKKQ